jgi:hypothetical protein
MRGVPLKVLHNEDLLLEDTVPLETMQLLRYGSRAVLCCAVLRCAVCPFLQCAPP